MSKKHFIALAEFIRGNRFSARFGERELKVLADFCQSQNPRFNRERWLGYIAGLNGPSGGAVK